MDQWTDIEFVKRLYDLQENGFKQNVEHIMFEKLHFFDDFAKETFKRKLQIEAMRYIIYIHINPFYFIPIT